jgi:cysteine-S-conjugate beta-lyase
MIQKLDFDDVYTRFYCQDDTAADRLYSDGRINLAGADFRFKTAPCIRDALSRLSLDGNLAYINPASPPYRAAIVNWMRDVREWEIEPDWIVPVLGTLNAMCVAMRAFTGEGDGVIVNSPYYLLYERILRRTKRRMITAPLLKNEEGRYRHDLQRLEQEMSSGNAKMMLLCNPHNPVMQVWDQPELQKIAELCRRHGILVVSDEIFAEHANPGIRVTPYVSLPDAAGYGIVTSSLGKSFNLGGCNHAYAIIPDTGIREKMIEQRNSDHFGSIDAFLYTALRAAYTPEGREWIIACREYYSENIRLFTEFLQTCLPGARVCPHDGGSLIWVDCRGLGMTNAQLKDFLCNDAKVIFDNGEIYGEPAGYIRCQMGAPRSVILDVIRRIGDAARNRGLFHEKTEGDVMEGKAGGPESETIVHP